MRKREDVAYDISNWRGGHGSSPELAIIAEMLADIRDLLIEANKEKSTDQEVYKKNLR